MMATNTIVCANAMDWLQECSLEEQVDMVLTSPPYDNLRAYQGYEFDYARMLEGIWRVIKPGGIVVWVVADQTIKGGRTGNSFRQALKAQGLGFRIYDIMIWHKPNPTFQAKGRLTNSFEHMFVFSKGKPATFNEPRIPCKWAGDRSKFDHKGKGRYTAKQQGGVYVDGRPKQVKATKIHSNVWSFSVGEGGTDKGHSAAFPLALPQAFIPIWSNPGDLVLDPMAGSGTTLVAAKQLERRWLGIDISQEYCKLAQERLDGTEPLL